MRLEKSRVAMHRVDGRLTAQKKSVLKQKLGTKRRPPAAPPPEPAAALSVDYPQAGEVVASPDYAIRISAAEPGAVEVSIDEGEWLPCRQAAGYWWRDWSGYRPGKHSLRARAALPRGRKSLSERREFAVERP